MGQLWWPQQQGLGEWAEAWGGEEQSKGGAPALGRLSSLPSLWPVPSDGIGRGHSPSQKPCSECLLPSHLCAHTGPYGSGIITSSMAYFLPPAPATSWKPLAEWVPLLGRSRGGRWFICPGPACGGFRNSSSPWPGGPLETPMFNALVGQLGEPRLEWKSLWGQTAS